VRILGFDWDETNRRKLAAHELDPDDVEWLFDSGDPDVFDHPKDARRYIALGFVPDERFVLVVFEHDPETQWVRVVTAYEAEHEKWWEIYRKAKGYKERPGHGRRSRRHRS
jgi:uncharacterized DUF497 family protein